MTDNSTGLGRRAFLLAAAAVTVAGTTGATSPAGATGAGGAGVPVGANGPGRGARTPGARSVGGYEVIPLRDAAGTFFLDRQTAFPTATPDDWARARAVDPGAFGPGDAWQLDFRCYAVRGPRGRLTLVDTGVGPDGSPAGGWAPTPGRLPAELDRAGIDPADVDTVVLTHLHEDHFGWSVGLDGTPGFPNARYVVQRREVATLPDGDAARTYVVEPLRATGQLHEVDGATRLHAAPGRGGCVRVVPTPGHTPGHQSVIVEDGHDQVIVTGDVLVHAVQLVDPAVGYRYEADPETARQTRQRLLDEARTRRAVLATAHLRQPWTASGSTPAF